jgi:hypothetical protein
MENRRCGCQDDEAGRDGSASQPLSFPGLGIVSNRMAFFDMPLCGFLQEASPPFFVMLGSRTQVFLWSRQPGVVGDDVGRVIPPVFALIDGGSDTVFLAGYRHGGFCIARFPQGIIDFLMT